ncbi:response regulator [Clostridium sp. DJ247]|uniref:response regulator transcription factor n=1 Tax=Clostridium sp. DJ247 TaxID=2726188 RepID=UPI001626FBFF|nr:response regulator [Clostridium sp. DJ247]MBC2580451.1 response regulator [Clostridium sp. DJ247]
MFNLLIVDDFEVDRKNLRDLLDSFEDIDINIVGECENGVEAVEFITENKVDIILSDIEMPFMNGLELAKNINVKFPNTKIIFCSLYDEFEYARKALYLNTYGYILKPLDKDELLKCLKETMKDITNETGLKKEYDELKKLLENSKPQLIDNFIKDILYGSVMDEENIWDKKEYLGVKLQQGFFKLVYIEIDDYERITKNKTVEQKQLFTIKVYEKLKEISTELEGFPFTRLDDSHFVYTVSGDTYDKVYEKSKKFANMVINEFKLSDISITISISNECNTVTEVKTLFQQCTYIMRHKFILGNGKILNVEDIPSALQSKDIDLNTMQKDIKFLLNSGTDKDIKKYIDDLLRANSHVLDEIHLRNLCFSIVVCVIFVHSENNESLNIIFEDENLVWERLSKFETLADAHNWIENLLISVNNSLLSKVNNKNTLIAEEIKKFIEKNYMKGISIDTIAAELHYSPNYLSYVFKQTSRETIADYMTKLKIEKAKEMLLDIRNKIYTISEALGFSTTAYFCNVFKKFTSLTPKEYRERHTS